MQQAFCITPCRSVHYAAAQNSPGQQAIKRHYLSASIIALATDDEAPDPPRALRISAYSETGR